MNITLIPLFLIPLLALFSCGKDETVKETKPSEPTTEGAIKDKIADHLKNRTIEQMDSIPAGFELNGPVATITENKLVGVTKVEMTWNWISKEALYYNPNKQIIETANGSVFVLVESVKEGGVFETVKDVAYFSVKDSCLSLEDLEIAPPTRITYPIMNRPLAAYDSYVIADSPEYEKLKAAEKVILAERAATLKVKQAVRDKEIGLKRDENIKNLLKSLRANSEFTGYLRYAKTNEEWRLRIRNIELQEKAGDKVVEFNVVTIINSSPSRTQAAFIGEFDELGNLNCKCVTGSNSYKSPKVTQYDGGSITINASDHTDKLLIAGQYKKYAYSGDLTRD